MQKPKIGLLPLYLELYDVAIPRMRKRIDEFYEIICAELGKRSIEVIKVPVCRLEKEFADAASLFEKEKADAVVTLHLAYSPSLESSKVLASTKLPLIILDTTPTYNYSPSQDPDEVYYNHAIHGVQDMCNLLIRNKKAFQIEAGHWEKSDVLDRVTGWCRAAKIVSNLKSARVGLIGKPFNGMGDFAVPFDMLQSEIGIKTIECDYEKLRSMLQEVDEKEIEQEIAKDKEIFILKDFSKDIHERTTRVSLAVRKWLKEDNLSAFSVNFLAVNKETGIPVVPFLEASKAMPRGIGYAGEGDVLTAALVGALTSMYPETTFTEMFCPDWENNSVFISHMGEMNIALSAEKPILVEMDFPYTDAENPLIAVGRFRGGDAVLVNLAPGPDNSFTLIVVPVEMINVSGEAKMAGEVRGWFKTEMPLQDFLEAYSRAGGTHHSALVYGFIAGDIEKFGKLMNWNVVKIN